MSFWEELQAYDEFDFAGFWRRTGPEDVHRALACKNRRPLDLLTLLAPAAVDYLEEMAHSAQDVTRRNFGNIILLYTPLYLANHCVNHSRYCSFNTGRRFDRRRLSTAEIRKEAEIIAGPCRGLVKGAPGEPNTCTMCGKMCAVRNINNALAGNEG